LPAEVSTRAVEKFRIRLSQQFASLDGSHPDTDPVPNEHHVSLDWFHTELAAAWSFAKGWDAELVVPYDVKRVRASYELPDGTEFDNPQGDLHHRDETLEGLADLRLMASWRTHKVLFEGDGLRLGAGFTIPTGRIEEDPYERGDRGLKHQHILFGTGTVDPLLRADYAVTAGRWSLFASVGAQLPLYENREGYFGARLIDFSIGPRLAVADWLAVNLAFVALYQTRAFWDGDPDENSGYFLQGLSLTAPIRVSGGVSVVPRIVRALSVDTRGGGEGFELDWIFSLSAEVAWGGEPPKKDENP
jgi:hypothetical protein